MVIAALVAFAILVVAWIVAPSEHAHAQAPATQGEMISTPLTA